MISYAKQSIDQDDINAVVEVLNSDWLTQGPKLDEFEKNLADKIKAKHVVAVSNGTAALHLACLAAGLKDDDLAVTSSLTFVATANAPYYCGARTALLDIEPVGLGIDPEKLEGYLKKNPETKVILPVHYAGLAENMEDIYKLANGRTIIEDASHALGGIYENGMPVGSCCYSDMTTFSFHPVKPITTAEGGAISTNDDEIAKKLRLLRNHGIERNADNFKNINEDIGPWYYEQQYLGYNYRLSDLQAALGISQLTKLDKFIESRQKIARKYDDLLGNTDGIKLFQSTENQRSRSAFHLYVIGIDFAKYSTSRSDVMKKLFDNGIHTQVHYIPVYRQPFHRQNEMNLRYEYINAENFYKQALSIPIYPGLETPEIESVSDILSKILIN